MAGSVIVTVPDGVAGDVLVVEAALDCEVLYSSQEAKPCGGGVAVMVVVELHDVNRTNTNAIIVKASFFIFTPF